MSAVPDYFELYEMKPTLNPDPAALRSKYYALSRAYHPDRAGVDEDLVERLSKASQVNEGYRLLSDPDALLGYVLRREGVVEEAEQYQLPPAFLMEMMELNEAMGDADTAGEAERELRAALDNWEAAAAPLREQYNAGERSPELLARLKDVYYRKKYLDRVQGKFGN